jgi:hypothetical protein
LINLNDEKANIMVNADWESMYELQFIYVAVYKITIFDSRLFERSGDNDYYYGTVRGKEKEEELLVR